MSVHRRVVAHGYRYDVCERCGIHLAKPHDALADADATAAVLPYLLQAHSIATVDQPPLESAPVPRPGVP